MSFATAGDIAAAVATIVLIAGATVALLAVLVAPTDDDGAGE